jgi:hypothetical protein
VKELNHLKRDELHRPGEEATVQHPGEGATDPGEEASTLVTPPQ